MNKQNQIKRTLNEPEPIKFICGLIENSDDISRSKLADKVCKQYGFYDPRGIEQRSSCLKAMRELEKDNHFRLPVAKFMPPNDGPRRLQEPVPVPQNMPGTVTEIEALQLILVETEEHMRIWNEMMIREHPQGDKPLVGRQLRYLIKSEHGWLGGFGFAAAALNLADRDHWIGWDLTNRRENLEQIVCLNRFLIRPGISCKNLASRVMGMCIKVFPEDFEKRYHYSPLLLESFVDRSQFLGTCYKASNWQWVGQTKGRGRQDQLVEYAKSIKDIYVYPLVKDFREKLGLAANSGMSAISPTDGLDESWAENEFGNAPIGDKRLSQRLVEIAYEKAQVPGRAITGAVKGCWSKVKGYYRLIDQPDDSALTVDNILAPHRERTIRRMKDQKTVLCLQDGTDLNYNSLSQCEGLGVIGTNQTSTESKGLHLHSTFVVSTEGLPLGVLRTQFTAPQLKPKEDKKNASQIPIEEKKTFCWIEGFRDCVDIKAQIPHTTQVNVLDREADFFELFDEQRNKPVVELLVRAKHDRGTTGELKLFESAKQAPIQASITLQVPRQSARPKLSKQKAKEKKEARIVQVAVRSTQIELRPPKNSKIKDPISINVVYAVEENPPKDVEPVEWYLLTTIQITTPEDAIECVRWYCLRWRIEDWHRVLKSGCKIEELAHRTAERIKRAVAINFVIAWRIMLMTLLGRETPELPAEILFSDVEIKVLTAYAKKKEMGEVTCLGGAVKLVAKIGGYLGRKNDPPPGHQLMWEGYKQLQMMCEGFLLQKYKERPG